MSTTEKTRPVFVVMHDTFMTKWWGRAQGKINLLAIECETLDQAEIIRAAAKERAEMRQVRIETQPPKDSERVLVSHKRFQQMGGWTDEVYGAC